MTRPRPYVGVSGVVSVDQQTHIVSLVHETGLSATRDVLLGVKAVHKTQFLDVPNKYGPEWYPVGASAFAGAVEAEPHPTVRAVGCAQVYLDVDHVHDAAYRAQFMERILARGAGWLEAVQTFHVFKRPSDVASQHLVDAVLVRGQRQMSCVPVSDYRARGNHKMGGYVPYS